MVSKSIEDLCCSKNLGLSRINSIKYSKLLLLLRAGQLSATNAAPRKLGKEANELRGYPERRINESNSLRGVERKVTRTWAGDTFGPVSMSLIPSGELKDVSNADGKSPTGQATFSYQ
jgi:hypothetical protein